MNKWVEEFKRLFSKDFVSFMVHSLKAGFILLFLLGLLMPFVVGSTLNNGHVSMSALDGAVFYVLPIVILFFVYIFTVLNKNVKLPITIFKLATIIGTITILWGFILFFVGFKPIGVDLGTGMLFMILFNAGMWYLFVAEKKVRALVAKYIKPNQTQEASIEVSKED